MLTRSRFAIPLLDALFEKPVLRSSDLASREDMPSKPMIANLLGKLKENGILKVLSEASGQRAQVLAFTELIDLCEGKKAL